MPKKISATHNSNDWPKDLADINSPNWLKGIDIIKTRFESRYFKPIEHLQSSSDSVIKYNCGFLIMSIDCLLIETLNQFYLGLYNSEEKYYFKGNPDPNFTSNRYAFRDFFEHSIHFPELKGKTDIIKTFYNEIRCGLLHQAQSKTNSLINIQENVMVKFIDPNDPTKGLIINRNLFHSALVLEFHRYLKDLENPSAVNIIGENLREKCNRKMADLCT